MSRLGTLNTPAELVVTLCVAPVPSLLTSTEAPGITAPLGSFTVPVKDPKVLCARLADAARKLMRIDAIKNRWLSDIIYSQRNVETVLPLRLPRIAWIVQVGPATLGSGYPAPGMLAVKFSLCSIIVPENREVSLFCN